MSLRSIQASGAVVMIRPHNFLPNEETRADNGFQKSLSADAHKGAASAAYQEVTRASEILRDAGVQTHLFEDEKSSTPDSVFPNNWFSTHPGGHIALYPMFAPNRRKERRNDIIEMLKQKYRVQDIIDYSGLEHDGLFLEGTGAMVLDHVERIAYAVKSNRTDPIALERFCTHFNYEPIVFDAADEQGRPVYHTNVLMCIATRFALVGLDMISDPVRRQEIKARIEGSGREVISLTHEQINCFAGNAIELQGKDGLVLALSTTALNILEPHQRAVIEQSADLLPIDIPTIEFAGGSVRCMLAGIHLTPRPTRIQ